MKRISKPLCLVSVLILVISLIVTGCSGDPGKVLPTGTAPASTVENAIDTSKPVKLTGYLLGDRPAGMDDVLMEINKKMSEDINTTIEVNYIGWADLDSKYPLLLAAGDKIDWIYTANWCSYTDQASKNAFYEIKDNMLEKYMPRYWAAISKDALKEAKVNGKVYMLPGSEAVKTLQGIIIREDLRKKYNVPEINKFSELEPYLEAIKKNEPDMIPINGSGDYDKSYLISSFISEYKNILSNDSQLVYKWEDENPVIQKITDPAILPDYKKAATVIKSWYDKGYINRNIYANKIQSQDAFTQGKSGIAFTNLEAGQDVMVKAAENKWDIKFIPTLTKDGKSEANTNLSDAVAISAKTNYPERTMMALDLIMEDPEYVYLDYFGIDGKNYIIKDGKIALPDGVKAEENTYPIDAAGFWFVDKSLFKPLASTPQQVIDIKTNIDQLLKRNVLGSFSVDMANIKTEVANLLSINTQYYSPIQIGMVNDVDAAFKILDEKMNAASIDKVIKELQEQINKYLAAQK